MKPFNKTLTQIWKNKALILEGIKNSVFKNQLVEQIAHERIQICNACKELDTVGTQCSVPGTQPCCSDCGCSLQFKTRSLSASCPLAKWVAIITQEEEDQLK